MKTSTAEALHLFFGMSLIEMLNSAKSNESESKCNIDVKISSYLFIMVPNTEIKYLFCLFYILESEV